MWGAGVKIVGAFGVCAGLQGLEAFHAGVCGMSWA